MKRARVRLALKQERTFSEADSAHKGLGLSLFSMNPLFAPWV